jgi:hypothetical protein
MDLDRRSSRSGLTGTAFTHYLASLRKRLHATRIVLGTREGLALAWSGDAAAGAGLAALALALELGARDSQPQILPFELAGEPLLLCIDGARLSPAELGEVLATIERIWTSTHSNRLVA